MTTRLPEVAMTLLSALAVPTNNDELRSLTLSSSHRESESFYGGPKRITCFL